MKKKLTKKSVELSEEEQLEQNENRFWNQVEEESKFLIADLIERNLPISATPNVFDLEKDVNYRILLRDDIPQYYSDNEEYQAKITNNNWTEDDVEYVAQEIALWYFRDVLKGIITDLSNYGCYENHFFENLTTNEY